MKHWDLAAVQTLPAYTCNYWMTWHRGEFKARYWKEKLGKGVLVKNLPQCETELLSYFELDNEEIDVVTWHLHSVILIGSDIVIIQEDAGFTGWKKVWMNVVRNINHNQLRVHDRCEGTWANPSILVSLSHCRNTHRKACKSVDVRVHQTERFELCLSVFKVALMRKALS